MAAPERQGALPFDLVDGWPVQPANTALRATEAGIILGAFHLPGLIGALRQSPAALSLRIDHHVEPETWTDTDGHTVRIVPPSTPVSIPEPALTDLDSLERWVRATHGSTGRIILATPTGAWWIVNDSDLELCLTCGPLALATSVAGEPDYLPFSWLPRPESAESVKRFYQL